MDYYFKELIKRFNTVRKIQLEIKAKNEEIKNLAVLASGCQSYITGMPRGSGIKDKVGDTVAKITDLQLEILEDVDKLVDEKKICLQAINQLEETQLRAIMVQYYVTGLTWSQVAENMDITEQWAQHQRDKAIQELKEIYEKKD